MEFRKILKYCIRMDELDAKGRLKSVSKSGGKEDDGLGNKQKPSESSSSYRAINWVMTWNNYPEEAIGLLDAKLVPLCERYVFGEEVGEKGTKHIQGAFVLKERTRQSAIYKLLGHTFYLDKMKGKWEHQNYCMKDGNYISSGGLKKYRKPMKILSVEQLNAR